MSDRGMKKWVPYKSLIEQEVFINKMRVNKTKIEKPILFEEEMEKINYYLTQKRCETLIFSFFEDGFIYKTQTKIKTIDLSNKTIVFENSLKINLYDLVDVEEVD